MKMTVLRCAAMILAASCYTSQSSAQEKDKPPPMPGMQMPQPKPEPKPQAKPKPKPSLKPASKTTPEPPKPSPAPVTSATPQTPAEDPATPMDEMEMENPPPTLPQSEIAKPPVTPPYAPRPGPEGPAALPTLEERSKWPEPVADDATYSYALLDLLELQRVGSDNAIRWDFLGWRGGDERRFWLKSEGNLTPDSRTGEADVQLLYGKLITPFFDFQLGARVAQNYERGGSATRVFAVVALQGLAPGRFEIEPALFLSNKGQLSGRFTATADLLQTQRLVFQPRIETQFALQRDEEFGVERGLNDVEVGLRVRYAIRRELAPYAGVSYQQSLGATRSRTIREGGDASEFQIVVGIRMWR